MKNNTNNNMKDNTKDVRQYKRQKAIRKHYEKAVGVKKQLHSKGQ